MHFSMRSDREHKIIIKKKKTGVRSTIKKNAIPSHLLTMHVRCTSPKSCHPKGWQGKKNFFAS